MKYKFTGKTKKHLGKNLHQIVCVTAFSTVSVGEIGGWIESEGNLEQSGYAWVSGNAWVYGNARVYGDAEVCTSIAWTISTSMHHVTITDTHITIGCQSHPVKFWREATKEQVINLGGVESAKNWFEFKDFVLALESKRNGP